MHVLIGVPLTLTRIDVASRAVQESKAQRVADEWAQSVGWEVTGIATRGGELLIRRRGAVAAAGHNGTLCGTSRGRD